MSEAFVIRPAREADNERMLALLHESQPARGLHWVFDRQPGFLASLQVTSEKPEVLVAESRRSGDVAAVFSVGSRTVFINGEPHAVRYGSDLRIGRFWQGSRLLLYLARAVRQMLGDKGWYQAVILQDNHATRSVLEGGRGGLPLYYPDVDISTFTITGTRYKPERPVDNVFSVRKASADDVLAMTVFVQAMSRHYQFLPAYNFSGVLRGDPYFSGLKIQDFLLIHDAEGKLRGLTGIWNQKAFKQTRIVAYGTWLRLLRPVYNLWAGFCGRFVLPKVGMICDYRVLHSPLTAPDDLEAFALLLSAAWRAVAARGCRAMSLTLADADPRQQCLLRYRSERIRGKHYLVSFDRAACPVLEGRRVPYFECGRL